MTTNTKSKAPKRGWFITFEGGEGSGKSTQISLLETALNRAGYETVTTREPGGPAGAEAVRHVLLSGAAEPLGPEAEAILFAAARSENVEQVIRPALMAGKTVLSDRFFDSTRVYQGATGNVAPELLASLEKVACEDCWPDLTIILDLDPEIGMKRANRRRSVLESADRFEKEAIALQQQRREAYLAIAAREPGRCAVIDAGADEAAVHAAIVAAVDERLGADIGAKADRAKAAARRKREEAG